MDDELEPASQPVLVVADNVTVLQSGRKRPDYSRRPKGALLWAALLPFVIVELVAVFTNVEWTLSRTVWWLLGPAYEPRWWLAGVPLLGLFWWAGLHFLWPHVWGGRELVGVLGVAVLIAAVGIGAVWLKH